MCKSSLYPHKLDVFLSWHYAIYLFWSISVTQTGLTETVVQVGRHKNAAKAAKNATQEEKESLIVSAEGSHELD